MSRAELLQIIAALIGALGTIIGAAETRLIRRFRQSGAVSREHPFRPEKLNPLFRWRLSRLMSAGVIVPVDDASYYLDPEQFAVMKKDRRKRAFIMLGLLTMVFLVLVFVLDVF